MNFITTTRTFKDDHINRGEIHGYELITTKIDNAVIPVSIQCEIT